MKKERAKGQSVSKSSKGSTEQAVAMVSTKIEAAWSASSGPSWERVAIGLSETELMDMAKRAGSVVCAKAFRRDLWRAMQAFRARTGRQMVLEGGKLVVLSAEEQARYALKHGRKARVKARRSVAIGQSVPLEQLPEAQREPYARKIEKASQLVAIDEVFSRKRDLLAGLGSGVADSVAARAADATNREEARAKLFGR